MIPTLEQRLTELSLRTFEKRAGGSSSFNVLQHVDSIAHDLTLLSSPSEFVGASALLFSQSFPHNALDFLTLAIKSRDLAKELIEERNKLYECLADFIKRAGAFGGAQDHLMRLGQFTEFWIKAENSSKTLQSCLRPMQSALECKTMSFSDFAATNKLAHVLRDRYLYGKASEGVSPTVKGALLTTLGQLCARCPAAFAEQEGRETLGAALRRLCIACLDEQLKSGDANLALVAGALAALRYLLIGAPCEMGEHSKEAQQIYACVRHLMRVGAEVKRFEVPFQAISLLLYHSPLLAAQLIKEPDRLFDDLRTCVHSRNDKIKLVAMPCCLEVLKTIARCLDGAEEETGEEDVGAYQVRHAAEAEEEEEAVTLPVNAEAKKQIPVLVQLDASRKRALLNSFMKRFSEYIQTGLKPPQGASGEEGLSRSASSTVRAMRKDIDLAIYGFGVFARTIERLTDSTRLSQVMFKLFELSDRLKQNDTLANNDELLGEDGDKSNPYRAAKKVNAKLFQRIRFLATYGKIALHLPASILERETVLERFQGEILSIQTDFSHANLDHVQQSPYAFNCAVEQVVRGLANKGACLPELLSRIVEPLFLHSLRMVRKEEAEAEEVFVYEPLWRHLLPTSGNTVEAAKVQVFDNLLAVLLRIIPKLNLECSIIGAADGGEDIVSSAYLLTKSSEGIVPRNVEDLRQFHLLTLFLQRHKDATDAHLPPYMPIFIRIVTNGLDKNPLVSSWYRLMALAFSALDVAARDEHEGEMDANTLALLDAFLETTCLRANQYQDELLCAALTCILQCPRGALLEKHMRSLSNCIVTALRVGLSHAPLAELAMDQLERWITQVRKEALLVDIVFPLVLPELAAYLTCSETVTTSAQEEEAAATEAATLLEQDEEQRRKWRLAQRNKFMRRYRRTLATQQDKERVPLDIRAVRILGAVGGHNRLVLPKLDKILLQSKSWDPIRRVEVALPLSANMPLLTKLDGILPRVAFLATSSIHRQTKIAACELLHSCILVMLGTSANAPEERGGEYFVKIYSHLFPILLQLAVDVDAVAKQLFAPLVEQLSKWFARDENSSEAAALLDAVIEALGDRSNSALRELAANTLGVFFRWTFKSAAAAGAAGKQRPPALSSLNSTTMLYHLYSLLRHPDPYKRLGACAAFEAFYRDFREQPRLVDEHTLLFLENSLISLRLSHYDAAALATGEAANQVVTRIKRIVLERTQELSTYNANRLGFEDLGAFQTWVFTWCANPETQVRARAQELYEALLLPATPSSACLSLQWRALSMLDENLFDEASARIDYDWWRQRRNIPVRDGDVLQAMIVELISNVCRHCVGEDLDLQPRQASALCRFLRSCANWTLLSKQTLIPYWECLLLALVRPHQLGLDMEEAEYKSCVPSAFQNMVRAFGTARAEAVLFEMDFARDLAALDIVSARGENAALLRAATLLARAQIKLSGQLDVNELALRVCRIPFGSSPQALKDGGALLRLCFELQWPVSSLIDALLDTSTVVDKQGGGGAASTSIGFTLLKHFSGDICAHLCRFPAQLGALLDALNVKSLSSSPRSAQAFQVLTLLLKDPTAQTNEDFASTFFPRLGNFSQVCIEVVPLLGQIMRLPVSQGSSSSSEGGELMDVALQCLQRLMVGVPLAMKSALVQHCLAPFLRAAAPSPLQLNERATDLFEREIVGNYFPPVTAAKLVPGMPDCDAYLKLLHIALQVLVDTQSLLLLRVLCHRAIKESELPVHSIAIQQGLLQLAATASLDANCMALAMECMHSLTKEASDALKRSKMALFDWLLIPLSKRFQAEQWEEFLLAPFHKEKGSVLAYLLYVIQQPLSEDASKECCYKLLHSFFHHAPLDVVQRVQRGFFPGNAAGNEATKIISKQARKVLVDEAETSVQGKVVTQEINLVLSRLGEAEDLVSALSPKQRLCNAVFTCLVAVVEKTQSQAKFFDSLVFDKAGNILHALIPARVDHGTEPKFVVREFSSAGRIPPRSTGVAMEEETAGQSEEAAKQLLYEMDEALALEPDCLNKLPAMDAFLLAIDGMRRKQLISLDAAPAALPRFCAVIVEALNDKRGGDGRQSLNIRLFAAKVVLNRAHLFSRFAKSLVLPLVQLLIDLETPYVSQGLLRGLHSFMQDVLALVLFFNVKLEWFAGEESVARETFSRLFALLFRLVRTTVQVDMCAALLYELKPLQLVVDIDYLVTQAKNAGIPYEQQKERPDALPLAKVALTLLAHCGANDYLARSLATPELSALLMGTLKQTRLSTGMTRQCAKVLAYTITNEEEEQRLGVFLEALLLQQSGGGTERCLDALAGLMQSSTHFLHVLSRNVLVSVLRLLPTLEGEYLKYALDMVHHCTAPENAMDVHQAMLPLLARGKLLSSDNAHVTSIMSCIQVVEKVARIAPPVVQEKIFQAGWSEAIAALLLHHPGASIRLRAFEYLSSSSNGQNSNAVAAALVSALSDANEQIQRRAFEFWERESPVNAPMDRLLHLLEVMSPATATAEDKDKLGIRKRIESFWVCHVSQLLLAMARRSEGYSSALLFKDPLHATTQYMDAPVNDLEDANVQSSFAGSSMNMPLFLGGGRVAATQEDAGSYYAQSQDSSSSTGGGGGGMLVRSTQQAYNLFAATQASESQQQLGSGGGARRRSTITGKPVLILRRYRKGEVPDIQILRKELIEPLLALCGLDAKVAFHLLVALLPELLQMDSNKARVQQAQFAAMHQHLTALLESKPSETMFATCLLEFFTILATTPNSTVEIDPELVGAQSLACKSYATGVFAIESYILRQQQKESSVSARPRKQARKMETEEDRAWRQLYALYDALNETDVLLGLAERSSRDIHLATTLDLSGKATAAIEAYGKIINSNGRVGEEEAMECYLARNRCFQKLRRWDESFAELNALLLATTTTTEGGTEASKQVFSNKHLLALLLTAGLKSSNNNSVADALHFLDKHASQTDLFERLIPIELIQAELLRVPPDWGRALDRTNRAMKRFLKDFSSQPLLAVNTRRALIQPLPQFTTFLDSFHYRKSPSSKGFFSKLESSMPLESQDGPEVWESVYTQRLLLLSLLRKENCPIGFEAEMESHLLQLLSKSFRQAVRTKNFDIGKTIVREMKRLAVQVFPQSALLNQAYGNSSVDLVFANRYQVQEEDYLARVDVARQVFCRNHPNPQDRDAEYYKRVGRMCKALGRFDEAMFAFEQRCDLVAEPNAQAHYELGSLAEEQFALHSSSELARTAITNLLIAFSLGCPKASNAFPRVLKLAMLGEGEAKLFNEHVARIPTASLLKWTAQLLSIFNQSEVTDLVLQRIAREFPQSFVYPFRVSREAIHTLQFATTTTMSNNVRRRLDVLEECMKLPPVVHSFCDSLERLTHPELRLRDLLRQIQSHLTLAERSSSNARQRALEEAQRIWQDKVLGEVFANTSTRGKYHVEFTNKYEKVVRSVERLTLQSVAQLLKQLPDKAEKHRAGKCALSEFSSWLDNFALLGDKQMEMPGSRDAWKQETTVHVCSSILAFDPELLVMNSQRKPKRLTIRGMDNSKHDFLVKGGEDLRLDERIQQLFGLMNRLMELDVDCAQHALKLETYKVIPVSLSCGLIEWIPHSAPVKSIIEAQYAPTGPVLLEEMPCEKALERFEAKHFAGLRQVGDMYAKLYLERDEVLRDEYLAIKSTIPANLLRNHFLGLAATPEAFLTLKSNFAASLATLSVCSWLLGIGDRHLENFMINALGELVAIDFGYSFGIGVVMLPVPETLPFRFTPQFSQFLAPLNANGKFFHCARRTLNCLRESRVRLLEVMEVFVNEPLLDWVSQAGQMTTSSSSSSSSSAGESGGNASQAEAWRALSSSRVRVADLKLRGVRPSVVMSAELRERKRTAPSVVEDMVRAVQRNAGVEEQETTRATLRDADTADWIAQNTVSASDQVQELIRMSTSESMLMRQWKGTRCWV